MSASYSIKLSFPLPAYVSPEMMLTHLQAYKPLMDVHPFVQSIDRKHLDVKDVVWDPFFTSDGHKLERWEVHDRIVMLPIPGMKSLLSKQITISAVFQSFEHGVRARANAAAGVTTYSTYEVLPRQESNGFSEQLVSPGAGDYDLIETATVKCGALLKPFVAKKFEASHREMCQKVIDELVRTGGTQHQYPPHELHQTLGQTYG